VPGETGEILNIINVEEAARLNWRPQETSRFEGSTLTRRLSVDRAPTAEALIVEPLVLGRTAHGETLQDARFHDHVRIRRAGRVIYADGMRLTGDIAAQMAGKAYGQGAAALATLVWASPHAAAALPKIRAICDEISGICAGTSLLSADLLLMRVLAEDSFELRRLLLPVLDKMTDGALPICWRL